MANLRVIIDLETTKEYDKAIQKLAAEERKKMLAVLIEQIDGAVRDCPYVEEVNQLDTTVVTSSHVTKKPVPIEVVDKTSGKHAV